MTLRKLPKESCVVTGMFWLSLHLAVLPNGLSEQMIEATLLQNIVAHGVSLIIQLASKGRHLWRLSTEGRILGLSPGVVGSAESIKKKWGPFVPVLPHGNRHQSLGDTTVLNRGMATG